MLNLDTRVHRRIEIFTSLAIIYKREDEHASGWREEDDEIEVE